MDPRLTKNHIGYWEIANKPSAGELADYYSSKYYQEPTGVYESAYTSDEIAFFNAKLEQRWFALQSLGAPAQGKMLDVGCGEGFALAFFKAHRWSVKGLDFSEAGLLANNPHCRDALQTGNPIELLSCEISDGATYDVVWLENVLEHVLDPIALLQSMRGIVSPGGIAVVTVPNDASITQLAALAKGHIDTPFWIAPPDHLSYFDRETLEATAQATGWECVKVQADFPIDWFLFNTASNYVANKSVGKFAHRARVDLENIIQTQNPTHVMEFWSSLANIGMGRNLTAFLTGAGPEGATA
jgi:2-polyprenyl-3-methyl-5-hydroxy-6-metoxy-1,4-benzoquinol methylase